MSEMTNVTVLSSCPLSLSLGSKVNTWSTLVQLTIAIGHLSIISTTNWMLTGMKAWIGASQSEIKADYYFRILNFRNGVKCLLQLNNFWYNPNLLNLGLK